MVGNPNENISKTISHYRTLVGEREGTGPVSRHELSRRLTAALKPHGSILPASVADWERGKSIPTYSVMLNLFLIASGWERAFALDILRALKPEVWQVGPLARSQYPVHLHENGVESRNG
jgi:hypothetical protein